MTYNVFGETLNLAQSNPLHTFYRVLASGLCECALIAFVVIVWSCRFIRSRFRSSSPVPDQMSPPVPPPLEDDYRLPDNCVTYFVAGIVCPTCAFVM